jgi:CarboxypepD_reg-like domain
MQHRVQLSIPQPCHENWQNMTPSEQGRFCSACAKEVVDFTNMNDTEVLYFFLDRKSEKVCGRVYPDQLNRPVTKTIYPAKKKSWYWNYAALLLLFFSKAGGAKAQGQIKVMSTEQQKANAGKPADQLSVNNMPAVVPTKVISGVVTDENGNPVSFATVSVKGTNMGSNADANGRYSIRAAISKDVLQISGVGYGLKELVLKDAKQYDVVLIKSTTTLEGEVLVIAGGISSDYYQTPASRHTAVIEVLDNATNLPVKATIALSKNGKTDTVITDSKGIYKLKRIKEDDTYKLVINAEGYLQTAVDIKGRSFNDRKETKYVFLEKVPVVTDFKKMEAVTVTSYANEKKYSIMGGIARVETQKIAAAPVKSFFSDSISQVKNWLKGTLKIAPNPVQKGAAFNVTYSVKQDGNYFIQITNAAGQFLQQQQVYALQKNNIIQVQTNTGWSSGLYYLRITDAKNNLISTNSFIVQ